MDLSLEGSMSLIHIFRKMADEKMAMGKPLPKEEVEFVLIGAGLDFSSVFHFRGG